MPAVLTAADARHWALLARAALAARRAEIDALNVFPVPDGDTGTNLYLTFDAAIDEVVSVHEAAGVLGHATLVQECRTLKRAILLAARGNSGVIVSQLVGGLCDTVLDRQADVVDARLLAEAFARGAAAARACVAHPQEGTILTVADAGAAAAVEAARGGGSLAQVCSAAVDAAHEALVRTPEQLEVLARAGVVDAGGAGCVLLLESFHRVVTGRWSATDSGLLSAGPPFQRRPQWRSPPPRRVPPVPPTTSPDAVPPASVATSAGSATTAAAGTSGMPSAAASPSTATPTAGTSAAAPAPAGEALHEAAGADLSQDAAYEVMYLLTDTTPAQVQALTARLDALGSSLLVVGGPDLYNVHVHVDDPGAAVEAGLAAGRPERIRITSFASRPGAPDAPVPLAVVACAAGPGIGELLRRAGAVVVPSRPGRRASAGQLLEAVESTRSSAVVLLPGDRDTFLAAEVAAQAAAGSGVDAHVVPARTTVQALAALAVLDPARSVHANVVAMTGAAVATRHGAVTVATKEALTWAGVCQPGDVLGIVDGDVAFLGSELATAAREVLDRLLSAGGELVSLVVGADAPSGLAQGVAASLERDRPELEVVLLDGGQPVYPLLIGVE